MGRRARRKPLPQTELVADIVDLADNGRGVARLDGKVVFVVGGLPGERVRLRLTRTSREFDEGIAVAIEQASPDRVTPGCEHFGYCGGCALQHLAPSAQIAFKQKQLLDSLSRIGGVAPAEIAPAVMGPSWNYRRRARLAVHRRYKPDHFDIAALGEHTTSKIRVGFRERDRPAVARLSHCDVLDARIGTQLQALAALIDGLSISEQIPQIEVSASDAVVALILRVLQPPSAEDRQSLTEYAAREGFDLYLQPAGLNSVAPLTASATALDYSPDGSDLRLLFTPVDFIQINAVVSQAMVRQALDWLSPQLGDAVLELFAGLGNFSLPLAAAGASVTAVEGEAGLVTRGRDNAQRNGLKIDFVQADLFKPDPQAGWLHRPFELALLDPPRAGACEVLPLLAATRPRRIVYVSCHPVTLARDAGVLVREHGYRLRRAGVLDMFPHTAHIESMALFERVG